MEKVAEWNATVISKHESGTQPSVVCELEPSIGHSCEERLKDVQGRVEAHAEGGPSVEQHDNVEVLQAAPAKEPDAVAEISETMQKQSISRANSREDARNVRYSRMTSCIGSTARGGGISATTRPGGTRTGSLLSAKMVAIELVDFKKDLKV